MSIETLKDHLWAYHARMGRDDRSSFTPDRESHAFLIKMHSLRHTNRMFSNRVGTKPYIVDPIHDHGKREWK